MIEHLRIRPLSENDSLEELTELLHRSYASLAAMGLRFVATYQTVEQTRSRVTEGECFVAELDRRIVGTIALYTSPGDSSPELYRREDVGWFGQFGVEPELQELGIGGRLLAHVEERAREIGLSELALDTAEPASHPIAYYERRGYRTAGTVDWDVTNYRSVLMSKKLPK